MRFFATICFYAPILRIVFADRFCGRGLFDHDHDYAYYKQYMKHRVRHTICTVAVFVLVFMFIPDATHAGYGAGIMIGQPTGLSILIHDRVSLGAAWSLFNHLQVHTDVWLFREKITDSTEWFLGVGGKGKFLDNSGSRRTHSSAGIRVPVGVRQFVMPKIELFGEVAPGIQLFPATSPDLDIAIGIRYHFSSPETE
jgi:hypothetical protein